MTTDFNIHIDISQNHRSNLHSKKEGMLTNIHEPDSDVQTLERNQGNFN